MYILLLTCPERCAIIAMMERVEEKLLFRQSHHLLSVLKHWPGGIYPTRPPLWGNDDQLNKERPKPCGDRQTSAAWTSEDRETGLFLLQ